LTKKIINLPDIFNFKRKKRAEEGEKLKMTSENYNSFLRIIIGAEQKMSLI